jgi:hypothetical protein
MIDVVVVRGKEWNESMKMEDPFRLKKKLVLDNHGLFARLYQKGPFIR